MKALKYNIPLWPGLLLITIISVADYQYFANWSNRFLLPATTRGFAHIVSLVLIMLLGRLMWSFHAGISRAWTYSYVAAIAFIIIAGVGYYQLEIIPHGVVSSLGFIRPLFCSPMPAFLCYLLVKLQKA
jgi:hypothetical protein